jgi:hypothetical protein
VPPLFADTAAFYQGVGKYLHFDAIPTWDIFTPAEGNTPAKESIDVGNYGLAWGFSIIGCPPAPAPPAVIALQADGGCTPTSCSTNGCPIVAVGDTVYATEGQTGVSEFRAFNLGPAAVISGINVTQEPTQGDASDYADMGAPLGGSCAIGNILATNGSCTVDVSFVTDTPDSGEPFDFGTTPFDLTFSVDDGRTAAATQLVVVSDPEPASLALLASGIGALMTLRRRSRGTGQA